MLLRRRRETVTAVVLVIQEGVMRGELPSWLDVPSVGHALAALLDGVLIEASEDGAGYRRSDSERRVLALLETLLAAASADAPVRIEAVPPRGYESARAPRVAS
jgi:DNA-binding transcriptional ArsR family regulator